MDMGTERIGRYEEEIIEAVEIHSADRVGQQEQESKDEQCRSSLVKCPPLCHRYMFNKSINVINIRLDAQI
jgi:hypothetical protein